MRGTELSSHKLSPHKLSQVLASPGHVPLLKCAAACSCESMQAWPPVRSVSTCVAPSIAWKGRKIGDRLGLAGDWGGRWHPLTCAASLGLPLPVNLIRLRCRLQAIPRLAAAVGSYSTPCVCASARLLCSLAAAVFGCSCGCHGQGTAGDRELARLHCSAAAVPTCPRGHSPFSGSHDAASAGVVHAQSCVLCGILGHGCSYSAPLQRQKKRCLAQR